MSSISHFILGFPGNNLRQYYQMKQKKMSVQNYKCRLLKHFMSLVSSVLTNFKVETQT